MIDAGASTLRLLNLKQSANIDYITFLAGSVRDVTMVEPAVNSGPDRNPFKGFHSGWHRPKDDFASVGFLKYRMGTV